MKEAEHKEKLKEVDQEYKFVDIHCPMCSERVPAANINVNRTMGKCENCQQVFNFGQDDIFFSKERNRPEFFMPEGTDILKLRESLEIDLDWRKSANNKSMGFLWIFTIFWNIIIIPVALGLILTGNFWGLLPMSLHLLVGIGFMYALSTKLFNKSQVTVRRNQIDVNYGPLPIPFRKQHIHIDTNDLDQLYVKKYNTNTKVNGQTIMAYGLFAKLKRGKEIRILKGMNKETQLYLEQEMERFLDIKDVPVYGETFS